MRKIICQSDQHNGFDFVTKEYFYLFIVVITISDQYGISVQCYYFPVVET